MPSLSRRTCSSICSTSRALDALPLAPHAHVIIAVPPIVDTASLHANEAIDYHRSNHSVPQWLSMLHERFEEVRTFRHSWREEIEPDFRDPFPSRLTPDDFRFEEADLMTQPSLTALFMAGKSRARHGGSVVA